MTTIITLTIELRLQRGTAQNSLKEIPIMVDVVVYTTPNCPQCLTTKRMMDKNGILYRVVDLVEHPEKLEQFKADGHLSAPIVTTDIKVWSGFRFEKIESLAKYLASDRAKVAPAA
jgi:glutaredoxin-like protein NrdH